MRRGTTPTILCNTEQDWTGYSLLLTIKGNDGTTLNFDNSRLTVSTTSVSVTLTQEESLMFPSGQKVEVQIKGKKNNNVIATNVVKIPVQDILNEEVL